MSDVAREAFLAGRDQFAQQEKVHRQVGEVFECLESSDVEVNKEIRGEVLGVIIGVRPAMMDESSQIFTAFESFSGEFIINSPIVANQKAITEYVKNNLKLAERVGWNHQKSLNWNLDKAKENHSLMGFVLGYPETVIIGMERYQAVTERGIPNLFKLLMAGEYKVFWEEIGAEKWDADDQELLWKLNSELDEIREHCRGLDPSERLYKFNELDSKLRMVYRDKLKALYEKYFSSITDVEFNLFMNQRRETIASPAGDTVYNFQVFDSHDTPEANDIQELREKVTIGFQEMGFNSG